MFQVILGLWTKGLNFTEVPRIFELSMLNLWFLHHATVEFDPEVHDANFPIDWMAIDRNC